MILSILVPTTYQRAPIWATLKNELAYQIKQIGAEDDVEILEALDHMGESTTGKKRNLLVGLAKGEYIVFVDDDDEVSFDYVSEILNALQSKPDAVGFRGWMTTDGSNRVDWTISKDLPYCATFVNGVEEYLRFTNHLTPIRKDIAIQVGFPDITHGEDYAYAESLHLLGLIKTEVFINKFLYHYVYKSAK